MGIFLKFINKFFIVFLILLLGMGFVSASNDIASYDDIDVLTVGEIDASVDVLDDVNDNSNFDNSNFDNSDFDNSDFDGSYIDDSDDSDLLSSVYDNKSLGHFPFDSNDSDNGESSNQSADNVSDGGDYVIVTSNVTRYDFNDVYKVKVLDGFGNPVYFGHVDFIVNSKHVATSNVDSLGTASFNINSFINRSGTYDIVLLYYKDDGAHGVLERQSIEVDNVPMNERDIQVYVEGIKLYDLGESYRVKVVDRNGNPIRKGYVCFVVYDRVYYSNLTDEGIATCYLPVDLNITGNLIVWSFYSDGDLYEIRY